MFASTKNRLKKSNYFLYLYYVPKENLPSSFKGALRKCTQKNVPNRTIAMQFNRKPSPLNSAKLFPPFRCVFFIPERSGRHGNEGRICTFVRYQASNLSHSRAACPSLSCVRTTVVLIPSISCGRFRPGSASYGFQIRFSP